MSVMRCVSPDCGRPFQLNQFSNKFSIQAESGKITCPHCDHVLEGDSNSLFLTHALSPDEEAEFYAARPETEQGCLISSIHASSRTG